MDYYIETVCGDVAQFDSGYSVFNEYIWHHNDDAVMHYIFDAKTDNIMAYFSLMASAVLFGAMDNLSAIPAIELKTFVLNKPFQGIGLSSDLLKAAIKTIDHYAIEYVGARIILLYAVPVDYVVNLYTDNGFVRVDNYFDTYKSIFNDGCIPMFRAL